jgi:cytochrome c-type biogenesis protein CcmH
VRARTLAAALLAVAALTLAAAPIAPAVESSSTLGEIEAEVMCPVCGTLLQLAESPQAQRERAFIDRLIDEGRTKQEIKDALVAEYGDEVLALPQGSGFELSAYLVPAIAFVVAVLALGFGVARWRRESSSGDEPPPRGPSGGDAERLDADLARYDL